MALNKIENGIRSYAKLTAMFIIKYRATILSAVVIVATITLIIGRKSDLIGFPFDVGVWGGVSDWVMVAVTFVTAIYLIKTFSKQQIITSLEQRKFLNSYLPSLELSEITYRNENSISRTTFTITIKRNSLQNLIITHNFDETFSVNLPYIVKNVVLPIDKELNFEISFELSPVIHEITEYSGNTIILDYEDIIGTKYCQYIFFLGSDNVYVQPAFRRR